MEKWILVGIFFMKEKRKNTLNIIPSMSITWNTIVKNLHEPSYWFVLHVIEISSDSQSPHVGTKKKDIFI